MNIGRDNAINEIENVLLEFVVLDLAVLIFRLKTFP